MVVSFHQMHTHNFKMSMYITHMASKPHGKASVGREVICWHKIDEVHETYRRSVEMCFGFYEANHLCQKGAFTCPLLPPYATQRRMDKQLKWQDLISYLSCGWSYTLKSGGVNSVAYLMWELPCGRGDLLHKIRSTFQLTCGKSHVLHKLSSYLFFIFFCKKKY